MLKKLIAIAATAALAKKAYDSYTQRPTADEQDALDKMAAGIQPKGARKPRASRRRKDGPASA